MESCRKFKAAILFKQNEPLKIEEIAFKSSLKVGQVLVKIHISGICGSQIGEITGAKGKDKYLPHLLGHEACASVLEIGPGVKHVSPDDLVVLHWRPGIGIQAEPPIYFLGDKKINAGWVTTFNSLAIVSENRCTKVPKSTNHELVAMFGCAITTAFGVIEKNAELKMGESILIYGSGGIGLNMIQAASLKSAWPIIAVDLYDNRLELAKKMGATHTINASYQNVEYEINKILNNGKLNVFIDNTGLPKIIEFGYKITDDFGKIVLVGVPRSENKTLLYTLPMHFGKKIIGSHGGETQPHLDIPRYLNLFENKLCNLESLITTYIELDNINKGIKDMISGKTAGRVIIKI